MDVAWMDVVYFYKVMCFGDQFTECKIVIDTVPQSYSVNFTNS